MDTWALRPGYLVSRVLQQFGSGQAGHAGAHDDHVPRGLGRGEAVDTDVQKLLVVLVHKTVTELVLETAEVLCSSSWPGHTGQQHHNYRCTFKHLEM